MKEFDPTKLNVDKDGNILIRYAIWKRGVKTREPIVCVSIYGIRESGRGMKRSETLHRETFINEAHTDEYYHELGRNMAALWCAMHCVGDYRVFNGTTWPRNWPQKKKESTS